MVTYSPSVLWMRAECTRRYALANLLQQYQFLSALTLHSMLQALDVTAETDGRSPQRTEYRPFGSGSALGQAWPAIGAVLLLLIILGGCLVWHWRRRSRRLQRICDAILERCRSCRQGSSRYPSMVSLKLGSLHVLRGSHTDPHTTMRLSALLLCAALVCLPSHTMPT